MTSLPSGTPQAVDTLCEYLVQQGFETIEFRTGGTGGALVVMSGEVDVGLTEQLGAEVRITADRGDWSLALRFAGMSRFITPAAWSAFMTATPMEDPDLTADAQFVQKRLATAGKNYLSEPAVEAELISIGAAYMRNRYPFLREHEQV